MSDRIEAPSEPSGLLSPPIDDRSSRLKDLVAQATSRYSVKDYNAAAEIYAHATELQAEIHGEMSSHNAGLLYAYGRCLYHVAINNSDVLGPRIAGEKPTEGPRGPSGRIRAANTEKASDSFNRSAQERTVNIIEEDKGPKTLHDAPSETTKPYFQFKGDENFDTSDEDAEDEEADGAEEDADEEDDFANAYEVLDMARVLLHQQIQEAGASKNKGKSKEVSPSVRQLQELLADTYDLQAEISLEGERFSNATTDLKSALGLKYILYPRESSIIAEAHYKLALALEFSSVTQQRNEIGETEGGKEAQVDYAMRKEAAAEMEEAIASCKARIRKEQENLQNDMKTYNEDGPAEELAKNVRDVEEMVVEMEQRVNSLHSPRITATNAYAA